MRMENSTMFESLEKLTNEHIHLQFANQSISTFPRKIPFHYRCFIENIEKEINGIYRTKIQYAQIEYFQV